MSVGNGRGPARGGARAAWILTCEHGGYAIPRSYRSLGLARADVRDHIGWDIGAAGVMKEVARRIGAPCVASRWSRLLVDLNRAPDEETLIPARSDGRRVPGNARLSARERELRLARYYRPYHDRVDRLVARARRDAGERPVRLLSVHSFTPALAGGRPRRFDVGVLFDDHVPLARRLGRALAERGFRVRYNQPYSGIDGLIYSARRHGRAHGIPYVELEVNNGLLRSDAACRRIARDVAAALRALDG